MSQFLSRDAEGIQSAFASVDNDSKFIVAMIREKKRPEPKTIDTNQLHDQNLRRNEISSAGGANKLKYYCPNKNTYQIYSNDKC